MPIDPFHVRGHFNTKMRQPGESDARAAGEGGVMENGRSVTRFVVTRFVDQICQRDTLSPSLACSVFDLMVIALMIADLNGPSAIFCTTSKR